MWTSWFFKSKLLPLSRNGFPPSVSLNLRIQWGQRYCCGAGWEASVQQMPLKMFACSATLLMPRFRITCQAHYSDIACITVAIKKAPELAYTDSPHPKEVCNFTGLSNYLGHLPFTWCARQTCDLSRVVVRDRRAIKFWSMLRSRVFAGAWLPLLQLQATRANIKMMRKFHWKCHHHGCPRNHSIRPTFCQMCCTLVLAPANKYW